MQATKVTTEYTHKLRLKPFDFFVLRTPTYPIEQLKNLCNEDHFANALLRYFSQPVARKALYLGSRSLYQRLLVAESENPEKVSQKLLLSLARYATRISTRATPFGLFAGIATGTIGEKTTLSLDSWHTKRCNARLDSQLLFKIVESLLKKSAVRSFVHWFPNSTLYLIAKEWRYIERIGVKDWHTYRLSCIESDDVVDTILAQCKHGVTLAELRALIHSLDSDYSRDEVDAFIEDLIESQVLSSDLEPPISGIEPIEYLIDYLHQISDCLSAVQILQEISEDLDQLHNFASDGSIDRIEAIRKKVSMLVDVSGVKNTVQIDLFYETKNKVILSEALVTEVCEAAQLLLGAGDANFPDLIEFRNRFEVRYECRALPLLEVLDEDSGIGFGARKALSSLANMLGPISVRRSTAPQNLLDNLVTRKVESAWKNRLATVNLTSADLEKYVSGRMPDPGRTCTLNLNLYAKTDAATESGDYTIHLKSIGGRTGAEQLGRFCYGDQMLRAGVERLTAFEADSTSAKLVDVCHVPTNRFANMAIRPVLRQYEIPYFSRSGAAPDRQISLEEIFVTIRGDRVVLFSGRDGCEIRPLGSEALAYDGPMKTAIHNFLVQIQYQGARSYKFTWPSHLDLARSLPRVTYGRIILSSARWRIPLESLTKLSKVSDDEKLKRVGRIREDLGLPRWISIHDYDRGLNLDLRSKLGVKLLIDEARIRRRGGGEDLVVEESLIEEGCPTRSPIGRHVAELVVPVATVGADDEDGLLRSKPSFRMPVNTAEFPRSFAPGSRWVYCKIYCSPQISEILLTTAIKSIVEELRRADYISEWFFIRFSDVGYHIRVRFQLVKTNLLGVVQASIQSELKCYIDDQRVWKIQYDTYEREVRRYGGESGISCCEEWFSHDSDCAVGLLDTIGKGIDESDRWKIALYSCHRLFLDFGMTVNERKRLLSQLAKGYRIELGLDKSHGIKVSSMYRELKKDLEDLIIGSRPANGPWREVAEILDARSAGVAKSTMEILKAARQGKLEISVSEISMSVAHMCVIRILTSDWREQEMFIYEFLARLYETEAHLTSKQA